MNNGIICVVGSRESEYPYMASNKFRFFYETDANHVYYNDMCGHRFLVDRINRLLDTPYVGTEHYRRAFNITPGQIEYILDRYDIIVKKEHGPWKDDTNLSILGRCSRDGYNYMCQAEKWIARFPELEEQASRTTHYGCNMLITTPSRYRDMMTDEFGYIDAMLQEKELQPSIIAYFCETILTPYIIKKYNKDIFIADVITNFPEYTFEL